jgi:hypothetical protein
MARMAAGKVVAFLVFVVVCVTLVGLVVTALWNWLVPSLFGGHPIGFLQALGLVLLGRILFGGMRVGRGWGGPWRHGMRGRWERMSPEEREKLREFLSRRCGPFSTPETETKI